MSLLFSLFDFWLGCPIAASSSLIFCWWHSFLFCCLISGLACLADCQQILPCVRRWLYKSKIWEYLPPPKKIGNPQKHQNLTQLLTTLLLIANICGPWQDMVSQKMAFTNWNHSCMKPTEKNKTRVLTRPTQSQMVMFGALRGVTHENSTNGEACLRIPWQAWVPPTILYSLKFESWSNILCTFNYFGLYCQGLRGKLLQYFPCDVSLYAKENFCF